MSEAEALTSLISNVGFPIAMCGYLVLRFEGVLNKLTDAINMQTGIIQRCKKKDEVN